MATAPPMTVRPCRDLAGRSHVLFAVWSRPPRSWLSSRAAMVLCVALLSLFHRAGTRMVGLSASCASVVVDPFRLPETQMIGRRYKSRH